MGKGLGWAGKLVLVIVVLGIIWAGYSLSQPVQPQSPTEQTGTPDFSLPVVAGNGLTGEKASLSSFRGKVVLLEFMVPWCVHCQNMAPVLESLYKQYGGENVVFLTVAGSWQDATAEDAAKFIRDYGSTWTYVYDSSNSAFYSYGVTGTPTFFIIGKDGSILATYQGEVPAETLAADIRRANS